MTQTRPSAKSATDGSSGNQAAAAAAIAAEAAGLTARQVRALTEPMAISRGAGDREQVAVHTDGETYLVTLDGGAGHCTCPDTKWNLRGTETRCKHREHVRYAFGAEIPADVREHVAIDVTLRRNRERFADLSLDDRPPIDVEEAAAQVVAEIEIETEADDERQEPERKAPLPDGGRAKCVACGAYLPDEIEADTGVYCPRCGTGQHIADGGVVLSPETRGERLENAGAGAPSHADGCDNPECEGYDADGRPLLSFECWSVWAAPEGRR